MNDIATEDAAAVDMAAEDEYYADTPTVDMFLQQMSDLLVDQDADKIQQFFHIEPPFNDTYKFMIDELKEGYPFGSEDGLEDKIDQFEAFQEWPAFATLLLQYFCYIRDIDLDFLLDAYFNIENLVQAVNGAFSHPSNGLVMLPTVLESSRILVMLATMLHRSGEDLRKLRRTKKTSGDNEKTRESLAERTSNTIQVALTSCLSDRRAPMNTIEGKKSIIYKLANLCLKVLFNCKDSENAEPVFASVGAQSPPLSLYPKAQRVTYLYYLGVFHYRNSHFWLSLQCLDKAYSECHRQALKQRRLILIPLVASNVIMGRFPSATLLSRPEAAGLAEAYLPVCRAIAKGDLLTFHRLMDESNPVWIALTAFRANYELRGRCVVLVWRALARKTLLIAGSIPSNDKSPPTFDTRDFWAILHGLERRALLELKPTGKVDANGEPVLYVHIDREFVGTEYAARARPLLPDLWEAECICMTLIDLGLMRGYLSHRQSRIAIQGAKKLSATEAGFPNAFQTLSTNEVDEGESDEEDAQETDEIPGWKQQADVPRGNAGPGMVINLSGVKAIGES